MDKITDIVRKKDFTISVELVPPRNGTDPAELYDKIDSIKSKVDFLSVTKGAGGSLRSGTLALSYFSQAKYDINSIAHFVCRERTKEEIESELFDLYYFGIRNVLALRGDPPAGSNEGWKGEYRYAYLLVEQIKRMNSGVYLPRIGQSETSREGLKTDFCVIVAGHPEDPIEEEIEHMKAKVDAGADLIITQMIFSYEEYESYVKSLRDAGITLPVLAGIRPLTSLAQAESTEKFFGLKVNEQLKQGLKEGGEAFGMSYCAEMIEKLKKNGCPGAHLFILNDVKLATTILEKIT